MRKTVKSTIGVALASFLALNLGLVAHAQPAWVPSTPPGSFAAGVKEGDPNPGRYLMHIAEQALGNSSTGSYLLDVPPGTLLTNQNFFVCTDPGPNLDCNTGKVGRYSMNALLPVCGNVVESCIEKLWIYKVGEKPVEASFSKKLQGFTTKGYPLRGIPRGDTVSVWSSDIPHTGGSGNYVVSATLKANVGSFGLSIDNFTLKVLPVSEISAQGAIIPEYTICRGPQDNRGDNVGDCLNNGVFEGNINCAYTQTDICGQVQEFAPDTRVAVQLRLHNAVSGWFHGRVKAPDLQVSRINSMYNRVKIDALPGAVSRFLVESRVDLGDPDPTKVLPDQGFGGQFLLNQSTRKSAFDMLRIYRKRANDTAAGVSNLWSISSMSAQSASYTGSQCLSDTSRVLGIVTTNATAYSGAAPQFKGGFLNYEVAGMHYLPGGEELSEGSYDLVMRSDVARCLYGFSAAPVSATISVVNSKGRKATATTVVSEKNGWLKMAAYGFTFSKKIIKVKVVKAKKTKKKK